MKKPIQAVKTAYKTKEEALAQWRNIKGNEHLAVVGCHIGLASFTPEPEPICWIILPTYAVT